MKNAISLLKLRAQHLAAVVNNRRKWPPLEQHARRRRTFQSLYNRGVWRQDEAAAEFYADQITALLEVHTLELGRPLHVVDLGCGSFRIGMALLARLPNLNYLGCDIVPELIAHNAANYSSAHVRFKTLDAVCDALPEADVCLVHQVLQHLSNAEIQAVLTGMRYPVVYVTEAHPRCPQGSTNPDKVAGAGVRFDRQTGLGRGVELSQAPFHRPSQEVFRWTPAPHEILITERLSMARPASQRRLAQGAAAV